MLSHYPATLGGSSCSDCPPTHVREVTVGVRGQPTAAGYGMVAADPAGGYAFALTVFEGGPLVGPILGSGGQTSNVLSGLAWSGAPVVAFGELTGHSGHPPVP